MDCRDIDEVSVLLLLSKREALMGFGAMAGAVCGNVPETGGLCIPVIRSLLKLSTSRDGFVVPGAVFSAAGRSLFCPAGRPNSALPFSCDSIVANVLENGLTGAPLGDSAAPTMPECVRILAVASGASYALSLPSLTPPNGRSFA